MVRSLQLLVHLRFHRGGGETVQSLFTCTRLGGTTVFLADCQCSGLFSMHIVMTLLAAALSAAPSIGAELIPADVHALVSRIYQHARRRRSRST